MKKISDMHLFDEGWNKLRQQIFANQKKLGMIPQDAQLTTWPRYHSEWDTLSDEAKKLYIREADVYGAFLAYTDSEIGRVIDAIEHRASSTTRLSSTSAATMARARKEH